MGIQLDWEVESDAGHNEVAEDAQVVAAEKRRQKFNRTALIILAVVLLIGGSIAWYRARIVRDEKLRVLKLTVEAEALALRIGDKDKFMKLQGPADDWRAEQLAHFDQMVEQTDVVVDGKIIDMKMTHAEARVVIAMQVNGQPSQAVWLYEYIDRTWKHISTEEEPWSERTDVAGSFIFTYPSMEQASVDGLRTLLDEWWALASEEMHVDDLPTLAVTLDAQSGRIKWDPARENHIIIPPAAFRDGQVLPSRRRQLARMISEYWAMQVLNPSSDGDSSSYAWRVSHSEFWLVPQTALWLESRFGGKPEERSTLLYLSDAFGDDLIPSYFALNHETGDPVEALGTAMRQHAPSQISTGYIDAYLKAIASVMDWNDQDYFAPELMPLVDREVMENGTSGVGMMMLIGSQPESIEITNIEQYRDLVWVTGVIHYSGMLFGIPRGQADQTMFIVPLREIDGYYQVTAPRPEDWGGTIITESPYVTFEYPEIDQPFFGGMVVQLEQDYLLAASTFGLEETPHIRVRVAYSFEESEPAQPGIIAPVIYSPRQICCFPGYDAREFARLYYISQLYMGVFNAQIDASSDREMYSPVTSTFQNALVVQAAERNGHDLSLFYGNYGFPEMQGELNAPQTLDELWSALQNNFSEYDWGMLQIGAEVLVDVLLDRYGQQALRPLSQNLNNSASLEEWLTLSLGVSQAQVEAEWQQRYQEELDLRSNGVLNP